MSQMQQLRAALPGPSRKARSVWFGRITSQLPEAYRKFWREWKEKEPQPVHWKPEEGKWKRNPDTGEVSRVVNIPIPTLETPEQHQGIWGGEEIIQGFQKRHPLRRRVPHFWMPSLKRSVVHSEILDKYLSVVVTERTLTLIDQHLGFDYYILRTPACDLKSILACKLKRQMYYVLLSEEGEKRGLHEKYGEYMVPAEEAEWYGLTLKEATDKMVAILEEKSRPQPLKHKFRQELIEELRQNVPDEDEKDSAKSKWIPGFLKSS